MSELGIFNPPDDENSKSGGPRATPSPTPPGVAGVPPSAGAGGQARGVPGGKGGALTPGAPPVGYPGASPLTSPIGARMQRTGQAYRDYGVPGVVANVGRGVVEDTMALAKQAGRGLSAVGGAVGNAATSAAPYLIGEKGAQVMGLSPPPVAPLSEADMSTDQLKAAYAAAPLPPVHPSIQQPRIEEAIPGGGTGSFTPPLTPQHGTVGPPLPEGVQSHQISNGPNIFARLTRPEEINQFGAVQYGSTPQGTTAAGMNQDIKQHGETKAPADSGISATKAPADSGISVTEGNAKATVKPLTQPGQKPKTPKAEPLDPFTKRKLAREMRMETGDLADDLKRGRISAKQAAVLAPLIKMKYAKLFGLDPGDAANANAKNNRTDEMAASEQLRQAGATEREAMRGASAIEASKARITPPDLKPVTLTDTDHLGNKTQRIEAFDPGSGSIRSSSAGASPTDQRWEQPSFDGFTWVGPEGGDRNDPNNWRENAS